jgi:hypothetical protein
MEWTLIKTSVLSQLVHLALGCVALVVGAILINVLDRYAFRKLDLEAEIARGNLAAAVLAGAMWLALAIVFTRG